MSQLAAENPTGSPDSSGRDVASGPRDLAELIRLHFAFIWRLLRRLGLPESDADDVAQQVFLVASAKLDRIYPTSERAFLYGCALRRAAKWQRARGREMRAIGGDFEASIAAACPGVSAEDLLDQARARALLDTFLAAMPVPLRSVFVLYEIDELSTFEIAELLGLPRGTVASRLRRARDDFEKRVKRWELASRPGSLP